MNAFVFRNISYGIYVLSAMNADKPTGCIINSVMQITSDPAFQSLKGDADYQKVLDRVVANYSSK